MTNEMLQIFEWVIEAALSLIIGGTFLLLGRRLFWLLGGFVIGFFAAGMVAIAIAVVFWLQTGAWQGGADITQTPLSETPELGVLIIVSGLIAGIMGAILLRRMPRLVAGLLGFVAGVYILLLVFELYAVAIPDALKGLFAIVAGVLLYIYAWRNHDTALIVLSTLIGANAIVIGLRFDLSTSISAIVWLVLMLAGIIYQSYSAYRERAKKRRTLQHAAPA